MNINGTGLPVPEGSDFAIFYCNGDTAISECGCVRFDNTVMSNPPPEWVRLKDGHSIILTDPGFYCVFFCVMPSNPDVTAALLLNRRVVTGTEERSTKGAGPLCGSAIISINADTGCKLELAVIEPTQIADLRVSSGIIMISRFTP